MRTAAAIVGFNRPYYFLPTLRSILRNPTIQQCDLWIFLDGGVRNAQKLQVEILQQELSQAIYSPRRVETVLRPTNLDCGRNLIDARRRLFDQENYDLAFLFEDDMVVGPHYMEICLRLLDWARSNYDDVGVVQAYNACLLPLHQKAGRLDEVVAANAHWWGYLMPRETWLAIRSLLYRYEHDYLCGHPYSRRDTSLIRNWVRSLMMEANATSQPLADPRRSSPFPGEWDFRHYSWKDRSCGQDAITAFALGMAGLKKLVTTVNRSLPIGRRGVHLTEQSFRRRRLHQVKLDVFESDRFRATFRHGDQDRPSLTPYMRADETEAVRALIRERSPKRVLEFGAGGSTLVFSRESSVHQWWAFEHNHTWIAKVLSAMSEEDTERITLVNCPEPDMERQLDEILQHNQFDMFFVDGFHRPQILDKLHQHLQRQPGFVLLHDHSRPQYARAIEQFSSRQELTKPSNHAQGLLLLEQV